MLRLLRIGALALGFLLLSQGPAYGQDTSDVQAIEAEQQAQERRARIEELRQLNDQEREARRQERQRQIDSLTDEQRQALRERRRIREANSARQRGQRPPRRQPPVSPLAASGDAENEEPA